MPEEVLAACPGQQAIYACDFYVEGAERGVYEPGGLRLGRILNVDHHAPVARMESQLTSTRLAYEHLGAGAVIERDAWVVINHTDCDSMLSSAMLMGYLKPEMGLVHSSLCADHLGEADPVADLLQALDEERQGDRREEQYLESLRNLQLLLADKPLEPVAIEALRRHQDRRTAASRLVENEDVRSSGGVAFGQLADEIDGAFFPALIAEAMVIMLASPHRDDPTRWTVKVRLGKAAPPGLTLHSLRLRDWDPAFGGRWNAGSNKRGGGTATSPAEYAERLRLRLQERLTPESRR